MIRKYKKIITAFLSFTILVSFCFASFAAERLTAVTINVSVNLVPGTEFGKEDVVISPGAGKYSIGGYKFLNEVTVWGETDAPKLEVRVVADEGYNFAGVNVSNITLNGGGDNINSVSKENSETVLIVTFTLPVLSKSVGVVRSLQWKTEGVAKWNPVSNAGSYEVRLFRGAVAVGQAQTVTFNEYDFSKRMVKPASYTFKVRAINAKDPSIKGEWIESPAISVDTALGQAYRKGTIGWRQDGSSWWYSNVDGSFTKNAWQEIDGNWYYFDGNGYMLVSAVTPDGFTVGADGILVP